MSTPSSPTRPSGVTFSLLLATPVLLIALSVYQWLELLAVRAGQVPSCSINETVNCAKVWNSAFAHHIHEYVGIPVAGLGVLWGTVALVAGLVLLLRVRRALEASDWVGTVKLWAGAGLVACVAFVIASIQAHAVCLTCLGTYGLVMVYVAAALVMLPGPTLPPLKQLVPSAGWAMVLTVPFYFALLYPGSKTPQGTDAVVEKLDAQQKPEDYVALLEALPEPARLSASWARNKWKNAPHHDASAFPVHVRRGPADAKVQLVEFSDVLCPHCAQFEELAAELERMAPAGGLSFEPRYYPLDSECNPDIKGTPGDGVRCLGAKLQICAEKTEKFFAVRREIFRNQSRLDAETLMGIGVRSGLERSSLENCLKSPETAARLQEDLAYARLFQIEGTPLVILNGKSAPPAPAFLLGMVLWGDADAPWFARLPPPPAE